MPELKFESRLNGVIEETAHRGNAGAVAIWETLDTQPEEFSEGRLIDINEIKWYDKKDKDISEEAAPAKNCILKELSEI